MTERENSRLGEPDGALGRREFIKGVAGMAAGGAMLSALAPAARALEAPAIKPWTQTSDKVIRIGIVGGRFGATFQWHLHPNCKVTAVCDIRPDRLATLQKVYQCENGYDNFDSFLKDGQMDAVGVFTPAPLHKDQAVAAMKAGKHVISAVPMGMSLEELEAVIEATRETGMTYMMAETSRFRASTMHAVQLREQGTFGTIFYSEAEYHHEGLIKLFSDEKGQPTWRRGLPPMLYPTHSTGLIVPVTGERLTEVYAIGWGDGHDVLRVNDYNNPFWNTNGFFKTSGGHSCRISICWHIAAGGADRGQFYGDRMSYIMQRPDQSDTVVYRIRQGHDVVIDSDGYPEGDAKRDIYELPDYSLQMPEPLRIRSGHGGSHTQITHEFISSLVDGRKPIVDVYEAAAYTAPGIVAHQSALRGGETMKIPDFG